MTIQLRFCPNENQTLISISNHSEEKEKLQNFSSIDSSIKSFKAIILVIATTISREWETISRRIIDPSRGIGGRPVNHLSFRRPSFIYVSRDEWPIMRGRLDVLTRNRERERRRWMLEETRWGGFSFEIFGNSSLGVASFSRGILVEENFVYNFPVIYFFFFSNIIFIRISLKRDKIGRWKLNVETEFWGKREGIAKRFGNSW